MKNDPKKFIAGQIKDAISKAKDLCKDHKRDIISYEKHVSMLKEDLKRQEALIEYLQTCLPDGFSIEDQFSEYEKTREENDE